MDIHKIDPSRIREATVTPIEEGGAHGWQCTISLKGRELRHDFYGPTKSQALKQFLCLVMLSPIPIGTRPLAGHGLCWLYTGLGGYPLFVLMHDGEALCAQCAEENLGLIVAATANVGTDLQWEALRQDVNWEDESLFCAHCNQSIEVAYPSA